MTLKERYRRTLQLLSEAIPEPKTELSYDTPFHLLLAVILSAQCTDKRVNMVTPALFEAFPDAATLAASNPETVYEYIRSVSYPNNKTRSLLGAARTIVEEFGGEIPDNIDDLMRIPGVGRKTANVMLAVVWNRAALTEQNRRLQAEVEFLKVATTISPDRADVEATRATLSRLVREIDKCITELND